MALVSSAISTSAAAQAPGTQAPGVAPNAPPPPPAVPGARGPGANPRTVPLAPGGAAPAPRAPQPGTENAAPAGAAGRGVVIPDVARGGGGADMTAAVPGGITAEQVASRAAATSYTARASEEQMAAASARAEQAWASYLPRVGLTARYTRLSDFAPPSFGSGSLVGTTAPAGTLNPTPTVSTGSLTIPLVIDQYLTQATIAVPISDYFLRIGQAYSAATHAADAARFDSLAARAKSYADGKVAYYTWLRSRGALVVAQQSLAVARAHQRDAENQFAVGNASRADVMRAQTAVAAAELATERAKSGVVVTERQIRIAVHAREEEKLEPGDALDAPVAAPPQNIGRLIAEAHERRPEIRSIDKSAEAARKQADVARGGRYPQLSAFGDVTYANPNPRRFPQRNEWFPTWSAGAQVTWSPNDVLLGNASTGEADARASALEAQRSAIRDGVELEVTQAYQGVVEADTAIETTTRQLESALEAYRVARELFNAGRGTSTTLIDAETALAQTRFDHLNARADARVARIRLDHALGRDAGATLAAR